MPRATPKRRTAIARGGKCALPLPRPKQPGDSLGEFLGLGKERGTYQARKIGETSSWNFALNGFVYYKNNA
jgi:hypothetical protein